MLTDTKIRGIKPADVKKSYKMYDEKGLYLQVNPSGRHYWRFKYRFEGKEKVLAMSSANLSVVRKLRDSNGSGYLFQERGSSAMDAADGTIAGKPVITAEDLSTIGNSPQVFGVLCGDFSVGYELVQYGGLQIVRDPYSTHGLTSLTSRITESIASAVERIAEMDGSGLFT